MSIWVAIVLGLIQGLTEFLPVSSSGHLTFFELLFGFESGSVFYNIILHVATLLALCIVMWKDIVWLIKNPLSKHVRMLLVSTLLTGGIGIVIDKLVGASGSLLIIAIGFIITSILLLVLDWFIKKKKVVNMEVDYKQAIIVGVVQGIAVLPGLSRSGSTLVSGVLSGAGQPQSARFSFLLSIPIILGGTIYETYKGIKYGFEFSQTDILPMIIGFIVAFISAIVTLKWMFKLVEKNKWVWFSVYLFVFAAAIIVVASIKGLLI